MKEKNMGTNETIVAIIAIFIYKIATKKLD